MSLALAGGLLTTGPPGKPSVSACEDVTEAMLPAQCPACMLKECLQFSLRLPHLLDVSRLVFQTQYVVS